MPITDLRKRPLRDLRISVTDRCNFRCGYCMPPEVFTRDYEFLPRSELLSFEEIETVASVLVSLGVGKIRITGGEPLLRARLDKLVRLLSELGIELALTTNGSLLQRLAGQLKEAGLDRVTVSLDSLDNERFQAMAGTAVTVAEVLDGIRAAADVGLDPIKINTVVRRGLNDDEMVSIANHFRGTGAIVRFIEFMDVGSSNGWAFDEVVPAAEIVERISERFPLQPLSSGSDGVATRWTYADGAGEIGVIGSVTEPFCMDCSRIRLSADGKLFTCLFADRGHDLRAALRSGLNHTELSQYVRNIWSWREDRYSEERATGKTRRDPVEMSYIGG